VLGSGSDAEVYVELEDSGDVLELAAEHGLVLAAGSTRLRGFVSSDGSGATLVPGVRVGVSWVQGSECARAAAAVLLGWDAQLRASGRLDGELDDVVFGPDLETAVRELFADRRSSWPVMLAAVHAAVDERLSRGVFGGPLLDVSPDAELLAVLAVGEFADRMQVRPRPRPDSPSVVSFWSPAPMSRLVGVVRAESALEAADGVRRSVRVPMPAPASVEPDAAARDVGLRSGAAGVDACG
jgi:hypothetical protein